jgi:chemotaxis protein MotB
VKREDNKRPIIIVRKKGHAHAGHHGGAWKVAYADFVTAMMAFFMVMWILGMDQQLKESIEGYFSNPVGFKKGYSGGKSPLSSGQSPGQVQTPPVKAIARQEEEQLLEETGGKIRALLEKEGLSGIAQHIEIIRTRAGLRIELAEGPTGDMFFPLASSAMKPTLSRALQVIGRELAPLRNPIIIEGHTDASQYAGLYSNWELSADRANAARRVLEGVGLDPVRVMEVRGLADREPRIMDNPLDPRNRRISIVLPYMSDTPVPVIQIPGTGN